MSWVEKSYFTPWYNHFDETKTGIFQARVARAKILNLFCFHKFGSNFAWASIHVSKSLKTFLFHIEQAKVCVYSLIVIMQCSIQTFPNIYKKKTDLQSRDIKE